MPSLAKINAQPATDLTRVERNHVHEILGVPLDANNDSYVRAEARFNYFTATAPDLNRTARAIMVEYDRVGERMTEIRGGSRGIQSSLAADRARQALNLRNLVFPPTEVRPLDDEPTPSLGVASGDSVVTFVPVRYSNADDGEGEYGLSDNP